MQRRQTPWVTSPSPSRPAFLSLLLLLVLAAVTGGYGCGNDDANSSGLTGEIAIDGSSTVYPITEAVAEEFQNIHPNVRVTVGTSGTGGGFKKFSAKEIDISDASRPIKPGEAEAATKNGVEFVEIPVAYDGLSIVINPKNDWADCLTIAELKAIWEPQSSVSNWNQVRPGFPDAPIKLYGAGTDSGTFDYFTDAIVGEEGASRSDYTASEDDNTLVTGVAGDRNSLGYFGYAYYEENKEQLKVAGVDGGDGCVRPSPETINTGEYKPLSRPLLLYVRKDSLDRPEVQAFLKFFLEEGKELITEVGYIPLPDKAYALALQRIENRVTGSLFHGDSTVGVRMEDLLSQGSSGGGAADAKKTETK